MLSDGVELLQIVEFGSTMFLKNNENDSIIMSSFMPRESKKDGFWIQFNSKNLHLESNSRSKVVSSTESITSTETINISDIEHMSFSEKCFISVECVLTNVNVDTFGEKKRITCRAYDRTGLHIYLYFYTLFIL